MAVREALQSDIESLTTIIPRSYDADAFLNTLFPPQSTSIREWWAEVYNKAIQSKSCHILVESRDGEVVGVLTLHFWDPNDARTTPGGICTFATFTEDHHEIMPQAVQSQTEDRVKYMGKQANFMIDLMAVDRRYQSTGIGKRLVERACDIADAGDAAIFLQTTKARKYYLKLGLRFESEEGDESGIVVRPAHGET